MTMYIVCDTEGSGLFDYKQPADADGQPRLAELSLVFADENLEVEREYTALIKPDGWIMPAETAEIHGLTQEILMEQGVPLAEALAVYQDAIAEGRMMAAHNAQHDAKQIRGELRRLGLPDMFEDAPNLCTMRSLIKVIGLKQEGSNRAKWPSLQEACDFFGIERHGAHTGRGDAMDVLMVMRRMKAIGVLPEAKVHYAKNPPAGKEGPQ